MTDYTKIDDLAAQASETTNAQMDESVESVRFYREFARLIAIEAAEAGDMARDADCRFIGDYIVEQLGFDQSIRHT